MNDRGAKALAEALSHYDITAYNIDPHGMVLDKDEAVDAILGTTGLFIADVTKHEPFAADGAVHGDLSCSCGWRRFPRTPGAFTSYFDHIGAASPVPMRDRSEADQAIARRESIRPNR